MRKVLLAGAELVWVCGQQGPEPLDTVLCRGVGLRPGFSKRLKDSVAVPGQEAADAVHFLGVPRFLVLMVEQVALLVGS